MKKIMLLAICCLAYVSVQAQSVTAEQIKENVEKQVEAITSKVKFSESQKTYLIEFLTFSAKEKAGNFTKDLIANPIKEVNLNTFFTEDQRIAIKENMSETSKNQLPSKATLSAKSKF